MDPVVGGAIITAGAQLIGGGINAHTAGKGFDAEERARREALAFEREREAQRRREYEEQQRLRQEQYQAYQRYRQPFRTAAHSILEQYGIGAPPPPPETMPEGWAPPTQGAAPTPDYSGFQLGAPSSPSAVPPITPPITSRYTLGSFS